MCNVSPKIPRLHLHTTRISFRPFYPQLCPRALHRNTPLLVFMHWISSQSPSACTVAKHHIQEDRDSFTALSNKHSLFILGCMKASNISKSYVFLETVQTLRVRNHVSAWQQEPDLSNRPHNYIAQTVNMVCSVSHASSHELTQPHHARGMQGHVRAFVHLTDTGL